MVMHKCHVCEVFLCTVLLSVSPRIILVFCWLILPFHCPCLLFLWNPYHLCTVAQCCFHMLHLCLFVSILTVSLPWMGTLSIYPCVSRSLCQSRAFHVMNRQRELSGQSQKRLKKCLSKLNVPFGRDYLFFEFFSFLFLVWFWCII
jgi:hypothetical protein